MPVPNLRPAPRTGAERYPSIVSAGFQDDGRGGPGVTSRPVVRDRPPQFASGSVRTAIGGNQTREPGAAVIDDSVEFEALFGFRGSRGSPVSVVQRGFQCDREPTQPLVLMPPHQIRGDCGRHIKTHHPRAAERDLGDLLCRIKIGDSA